MCGGAAVSATQVAEPYESGQAEANSHSEDVAAHDGEALMLAMWDKLCQAQSDSERCAVLIHTAHRLAGEHGVQSPEIYEI